MQCMENSNEVAGLLNTIASFSRNGPVQESDQPAVAGNTSKSYISSERLNVLLI
jgi:hypothetical protein